MSVCINLIATVFFRKLFYKLDIVTFQNWQGINPMGLSASLAEYKYKQLFTNIKM